MNLTIRTRLLIGFVLLLTLLILLGLLMISKLSDANERLTNIVDNSTKKVNLSNEILIAVLNETRHEKNIILESDPVKKDGFKDLIYESTDIVDTKVRELEKLVDAEGKVILDEFKDTWTDFLPYLDEIVSLAIKEEDEKAFQISSEKGLVVRRVAIEQIARLIEKNEASVAADKMQNEQSYKSALNLIAVVIIAGFILIILISVWIIRSISQRIAAITKEAEKIASREFTNARMEDHTNDELKPVFNSLVSINESFREVTENASKVASGDYSSDLVPLSDKDALGNALKKMTHSLRETTAANEKHNWLSVGQNQLSERLIGDQSIEELASNTIGFLCSYLNANIGAVYVLHDKSDELILSGQYAFSAPLETKEKFALREGLVGQAASERKQILLNDITEEQLRVSSSVLSAKPKHLIITPFTFDGKTAGVIELGKLEKFSETELEFINSSMEGIAISINSAKARKRIQDLLEETQVQSEELQTQQEELKQMNEELEEQAQNLKQQQEELQITNEELEEQTQALEMKNKEVEASRFDIEQKTKQLEVSSKYKSEFLANMSHELRTPLNSLLILSKDLSENKKKTLDADQVESAEIIYKSGHELLVLINEVLDLSKIEAGKMVINAERITLRNFIENLSRDFRHQADQKGLKLTIDIDPELPESIRSDAQRLNQILKNLVSNAIKFTEKGSVAIRVGRYTEKKLVIAVSDTGIGIPEDKQMAIFEAFQQADGGTSRKYGGTGLGLSISRELAKLLGAEISVKSEPNKGSVFSVVLPFEINQTHEYATEIKPVRETVIYEPSYKDDSQFLNYPAIDDDRDSITADDKVVLIIEDDLKFAEILLTQANNKGFKCLSASTGEDGLRLATTYKPHAIILDIDLPGIDGNKVLSALKANPEVRHIPVHIVSVNERSLDQIREGAIEYLMKPIDKKDLEEAFNRIENFVSRKVKNLLIIEDDENARKAMRKLIGNGDVKCFEADNGSNALAIYNDQHIDCIILDLGLPDMTGFEFIYKLDLQNKSSVPPIIVYTGKELTKEENEELRKYSESIIIKGVKSEERLLDETALFLHRTIKDLPETKQLIIHNLYDKEAVFQRKKILLVDDDMRNVFALSRILKERGMEIIKADNGKNALEMLARHDKIDLVLMDIMMPEMDGYEAMKIIRTKPEFKKLPIIALTAKAMKDDRQKCIDAGANDYITKPVDVERLLSLMRVWLGK
ncbi:MAG: response regulator [Bacteroidetes bacterium]|nr:response regulator [Bacteroidota bacterium]